MHVTAAPGRALLAQELASKLDAEATTYERSTFPDGEIHVRLAEEVDGPVVVLADARPNERLVEALLAADAALEAGARERILAVPYLAYARQDRVFEPGEAVSARAVNRALGTAADALCTVDVHAEAVLEHFPGPTADAKAIPELAEELGELGVELVLAPDEGARSLAEGVAERLEIPHDHLVKTRHSSREVSMEPKDLDASGARVAIVDDIIATGGTMATATGHLLEAGAERVLVAATHGVFASGADKRLEDAGVDEIIVTDAIPSERSSVSCAGAIARGVSRLLSR